MCLFLHIVSLRHSTTLFALIICSQTSFSRSPCPNNIIPQYFISITCSMIVPSTSNLHQMGFADITKALVFCGEIIKFNCFTVCLTVSRCILNWYSVLRRSSSCWCTNTAFTDFMLTIISSHDVRCLIHREMCIHMPFETYTPLGT